MINWEKTNEEIENKHIDLDLPDKYEKEKEILLKFQEEWDIVYSKVNLNNYSVKFKTKNKYDKFKNYALDLAKPYYIFEGDVLDFVRVEREYNGIIELQLLSSFEIKNTLAKILGIRKDYEQITIL